MNIETPEPIRYLRPIEAPLSSHRRHLVVSIAMAVALGGAPIAFAQVLSPPIAGGSASTGGADKPLAPGVGPGYHDPRSAFKPLEERDGIVSWQLLSMVTTKAEKNRMAPTFPAPVLALNEKKVKVQGFMMPLEPGDKQRHFLLSAVPTTCGFCIPAGPEGLIEVRARTPVKYTGEAVVLEGRLAVLSNDPYGLFYRITDGEPVQ
jgi:hypothetical protein